MEGYTATTADGTAIHYVDRKRYWWMLAVFLPLQPLLAALLIVRTGNELWVVMPFLSTFVVTPALDWIIGEDRDNPPDEVLIQLDRDRYYRRLTYAIVPMHFLSLIATLAFAARYELSTPAFIGMALLAGLTSGLAINTGHELGHKNSRMEKLLARLVLAIPGYGHFSVEHNRGHHMHVATVGDSSSARMGESVYKFACREIPGSIKTGWRLERERLAARGKSVWHHENVILQSYAVTASLWLILIMVFGLTAIPFLLIHNAMAYWQLTSANYIEHYGLLRKSDEAGKPERCKPHHSWNCNYLLTNLALFHLQRHSDHHTNPLRRYQALRNYDDLPQLPNGYFGMYVLAYIPWLWFRIMDPRLMALPHVKGDLDNVNIDPDAQPALFLRWGRDKMAEPTCSEPRIS